MYYELYIDVLFLENLLLDYMLLRLAGRFLGRTTTRLRTFGAAVLGSAAFCLLSVLFVGRSLLGLMLSGIGVSVLMAAVGFRQRSAGQLLPAVLFLYVCSLLLGGIAAWVSEIWPGLPFTGAAAAGMGVLDLALRWLFAFRRKREELYPVTICFRGTCRQFTGLRDTGNRLRDPLHQKPVSIVMRQALEPEISEEELIFQIPYHSVGRALGMLDALIADSLTIRMGEREVVIERPVLGLTEEPLSSDGSYDLILNPDLTDN